MKIRYGVISGLIILAFISMAGVCAAEESTMQETPALTETQPLSSPDPDFNMIDTMTGDTRTRQHQYRPDFDGSATNRTIGPDNPLYGLRIAFEDLDESFTFNGTERLEKQIRHGNDRLSDYLDALSENNTESAGNAFGMYRQKMNQTEGSLHQFRQNDTGLLHAQEMITKHQEVLGALLKENPDNPGLARAYNNSQQLQNKFEEKTRVRFQQTAGEGNTTSLMPVMIENAGGRQQSEKNGQDNSRQNGKTGQQDTNQSVQDNRQNQNNNPHQNNTPQQQDPPGQSNGQQSDRNGVGNGRQNQVSDLEQDTGRDQQPGQGNGQKR